MDLIVVRSLAELKQACNHPHRSGEYLRNGTQVFEVSEDDNENEQLIEESGGKGVIYGVNWDDQHLYTAEGVKICPVYK